MLFFKNITYVISANLRPFEKNDLFSIKRGNVVKGRKIFLKQFHQFNCVKLRCFKNIYKFSVKIFKKYFSRFPKILYSFFKKRYFNRVYSPKENLCVIYI